MKHLLIALILLLPITASAFSVDEMPKKFCWQEIFINKNIGFYYDRCSIKTIGKNKVKAWFKTEYLSAKHLTDATEVISQKYLDCSNNQMAEVQTLSYLSGRLTEKELSKNIQYKYYPSIAATQPYMDMFFRTCW